MEHFHFVGVETEKIDFIMNVAYITDPMFKPSTNHNIVSIQFSLIH